MKKAHKYIGFSAVIIFMMTGLYMKVNFPGLYNEHEAIRYTFRANHVYILLSGLVNIALGIYLRVQEQGWKRHMQHIGSGLLLIAPMLLIIAFFYEAPLGTPERYLTSTGVLLLFVGVIFHLPNVRF
jgi:hypothetical protein